MHHAQGIAPLAITAAMALTGTTAHAAPKPAMTVGVHARPGDPASLLVETSFGLLVTRDDGCAARWICPAAIGARDDVAPVARIARDGTLFATTTHGLRASRDGGCTFTTAAGTDDTWIAAIDIGPTGEVWLATADGRKANEVLRSRDGGATFASAGLRSSTIWWRSVVVAPTRVYASGYEVAGRAPRTHVAISDDDGASWRESPLAELRFAATPLVIIKAVDAANTDRVFASSVGAADGGGDRLYRSLDGGATWREVLATGAIGEVAIAGDTVIVSAAPRAWISHDGGATFSEAGELGCATARDDGSWLACGRADRAAVLRSRDGAAWQAVLALDEIAGPLACPAGTPQHDACEPAWPALRDQLGATGAAKACPEPAAIAKPPTRGGCCDAGGEPASVLAAIAIFVVRRRRR